MNKYNYLYALLIDLSISAQAGVVEIVSFSALPMAVVWGSGHVSDYSYKKPIISDYIILTESSGNAENYLVPGNSIPILTGVLTKPSHKTDEYSLSQETNSITPLFGGDFFSEEILKKSFYVASNCPFHIYVQTGSEIFEVNSQNNFKINLTMSITQSGKEGGISHGGKSQSPTEGGAGFIDFPVSLSSLNVPTKIYSAGRKTAATSGSITEQSVRFNIEYEIIREPKLKLGVSYLAIPVTYTIYIP